MALVFWTEQEQNKQRKEFQGFNLQKGSPYVLPQIVNSECQDPVLFSPLIDTGSC